MTLSWPSFIAGGVFILAAQGILFSAVVFYFVVKGMRKGER